MSRREKILRCGLRLLILRSLFFGSIRCPFVEKPVNAVLSFQECADGERPSSVEEMGILYSVSLSYVVLTAQSVL
jgi:hypothetical protein